MKDEEMAEEKYCKGCKLRMEQCLWAWRNTNGLNEPNEKNCSCKEVPSYIAGAEFGYNKANVRHSPDEHIDKDRVVLGIIKLCNKTRYSLVQWNGEWWYQYGTFNAEVRLIAWYNIPELKKERNGKERT